MSALPAPVRSAIRERRVQLDLTQVEAAAAGNVSPATWGAVEKGRSQGSNLIRASMCKALGWSGDSIDRLVAGGNAIEAEAATTGDVNAAIAQLAAAVGRISDEVAGQRLLIDRLAAAELARRQ